MVNDHIAVSGEPTFDQLLSDPCEQFDTRSELLASVLEYLSAPPASVGTNPQIFVSTAHQAWLFAPSSTTGGGTAVA